MKAAVLTVADLKACLPLGELRAAMKQALTAVSANDAKHYPRFIAPFRSAGGMGFMPASNDVTGLLGYKAVAVFHANAQKGINPHQGIVALLDETTGQLKCLMDGSTVTALRTPAASAASTELLSRADSHTLAIVGAGKQGYEHAVALVDVRPIQQITIYNRSAKKAEETANALRKSLKLPVKVVPTPQEAVADADIVALCTNSREPFLKITDFKPGAHINAAGACRPGFREVDLRNHPGLKIYLDSNQNCEIEADEVFVPLKAGVLDKKHVLGELGEAFLGKIPGREHPDEITFFKSVGIGVEDIYAAECAFQNARRQNRGAVIDFGEENDQ